MFWKQYLVSRSPGDQGWLLGGYERVVGGVWWWCGAVVLLLLLKLRGDCCVWWCGEMGPLMFVMNGVVFPDSNRIAERGESGILLLFGSL